MAMLLTGRYSIHYEEAFRMKHPHIVSQHKPVTTEWATCLSPPKGKHLTSQWNVEYVIKSSQRRLPALRASKQAWPISSFSSWFSVAMASPTATKRPTATLTAWPTLCMAARVRSDFFGLSLWLIRVVICRNVWRKKRTLFICRKTLAGLTKGSKVMVYKYSDGKILKIMPLTI